MRFDGKVLFATGGGSGIGAATAQRFVQDGGRVAVVDYREDAAKEVAASLGGLALTCDVSDESSVERAIAKTVGEFGRIDCVFNGAGHAGFGPLGEWTMDEFNRMMIVHVGGTFLVTKYAAPHLRSSGDGAIVNVASVAAILAQDGNAPYGAAKAGIIGLTQQTAREFAPEVRVNVVAPGRVLTGMTVPVLTERGGGDLDTGIAMTAKFTALGRMGTPEQLAGTVCHLFSEDAGFTTGSVVVVDGGETIM